jgi:hypothetical protein
MPDGGAGRIIEAVPVEHLALDTIAMQWREALDGAEETLDELSRSRQMLRFPPVGCASGSRSFERSATDAARSRAARPNDASGASSPGDWGADNLVADLAGGTGDERSDRDPTGVQPLVLRRRPAQ